MKKSVVFMFSGQGSQYYHMGKELYDNHPRFKYWMDFCDVYVKPLLGVSLIDLLYRLHKKSEPFDQIVYSNPALLCVEYSLAKTLTDLGIKPDYLLGYSLGEITSSVVSGALSLENGIKLVIESADLVERETVPASMLAVIESENIMQQHPNMFSACWLTGRNYNGGFVIGGLLPDLERVEGELKERNILCQMLPVKNGFHTPLIDPIKDKFKHLLIDVEISAKKIPIISSFKVGEVHEINSRYYWQVLRALVEFQKTIELVSAQRDSIFIDVGPSGTLSTFVKYILPANSGSTQLELINPFGKNISTLEKVLAKLEAVKAH